MEDAVVLDRAGYDVAMLGWGRALVAGPGAWGDLPDDAGIAAPREEGGCPRWSHALEIGSGEWLARTLDARVAADKARHEDNAADGSGSNHECKECSENQGHADVTVSRPVQVGQSTRHGDAGLQCRKPGPENLIEAVHHLVPIHRAMVLNTKPFTWYNTDDRRILAIATRTTGSSWGIDRHECYR
jgi:hypothetical protein